MKKIALLGMVALAIPLVLADYGGMMGYGSGYGMMGVFGMGLYSLLWLVIAAFVFSWIFWSTYKWMLKEKQHKK